MNTKQTSYSEKLRDPRWQKKRLCVMQRDGFACRDCGDEKSTLQVHHCHYEKGGPWATDERFLLTLCGDCHKERGEVEKDLKTFFGEITTIKLFEDNSLVRERLNTQGYGKVLVIDGGGSTRCALVGDQLAELAIKNHWEGILVNGCIRDSFIINKMKISIKAINTSPVKSIKRLTGEYDIPVKFAGINFYPGHFLYSDKGGLLVSIEKLH